MPGSLALLPASADLAQVIAGHFSFADDARMVGVALGGPRYFVDPLVGLLWVLLGLGLRLLLQVVEFAHIVLVSYRVGPGPCAPTPELAPMRWHIQASGRARSRAGCWPWRAGG